MQYFNILLVSLTVICWIVIYPEDSATQYLNNWGQKCTQLSMRTGGKTRLPTVTLAVSGHSGLGDKDNHYKEAWCSVVPHKIIIRSGLFVTQDTGYERQNKGL